MTAWFSTIMQTMSQPLRWWVVVAPWEQGVRIRLGKTAVVLNPGIHLRIPFLDRAYVQCTRLRIVTSRGHTVMTLDKKVVTIALATQFVIQDIKQLYSTISNPENTLVNCISSLAAEYLSKIHSDDLSYKALQAYVNDGMVDKDWGLSDISVSVIDFAFARTYRLIGNSYSERCGLNFEQKDNGIR